MATKQRKTRVVAEYGDFQTPLPLAHAAMARVRELGIRPRAILEPTCGRGAFIAAAIASFPETETVVGIDINAAHLAEAASAARQAGIAADLRHGDFFTLDWGTVLVKDQGPWLIVGNPPWVTSAELGALASENLPEKSNFQGRRGIEAITGKSNFDISEWMLLRYLDWLENSTGTIAVLCKTAVARKILLHIWRARRALRAARMYRIDAQAEFGVAVDACFLVLQIEPGFQASECAVFEALDAESPSHAIGFLGGHIVADLERFGRSRGLLGPEERYVWRSGVKHDCSRVMELVITPEGHRNGLGETVALEDAILFPMLKSSDVGNRRIHCRGAMLVTQEFVGQDTAYLRTRAPKTWEYLTRHADLLSKRGSVIYKNKPPFSVFGVGPYSFAPWKVAISGFYKSLHFLKVGPLDARPVMLDDTIYFLPCWSEEEADFLEALLRSPMAEEFYRSMIHWDEKRPITVDILKRLSISKLAAELGRADEYDFFTRQKDLPLFADAGRAAWGVPGVSLTGR